VGITEAASKVVMKVVMTAEEEVAVVAVVRMSSLSVQGELRLVLVLMILRFIS